MAVEKAERPFSTSGILNVILVMKYCRDQKTQKTIVSVDGESVENESILERPIRKVVYFLRLVGQQ